jgi:hypothetical protein
VGGRATAYGDPVRVVPGWALVSATAAPVLLIGGWTLGAARQPGGFDAVTGTISALAALGATDRWIMTTGLAGLGVAHLVTAAGLRPARRTGRLLLALGGLATLAVAAFAQPATGTSTAHGLAAAVAFVALALWPAFAAPGDGPTDPDRTVEPTDDVHTVEPTDDVRTVEPTDDVRTVEPTDAVQGAEYTGAVRTDRSTGAIRADGASMVARTVGGAAVPVTVALLLLALVGWFAVELVGGGARVGLAERVAAGAEACCPLLFTLVWRRRRRQQ